MNEPQCEKMRKCTFDYGKCPKILYNQVVDKMAYANSAGSTLFAIPLSILRNNCIKSKFLANKVWNKVFEILGHLNKDPDQSIHLCSLISLGWGLCE